MPATGARRTIRSGRHPKTFTDSEILDECGYRPDTVVEFKAWRNCKVDWERAVQKSEALILLGDRLFSIVKVWARWLNDHGVSLKQTIVKFLG
jgi:hypothetical protein